MQPKDFLLQNRGMNRSLSISKTGESTVYENRNIRIIAKDNDTILSVTNERGTKDIHEIMGLSATLLGWNVLNEHIILFFHGQSGPDRIIRLDYDNGTFSEEDELFIGDLGFDVEYPIESVVYYESEEVQKVYWVDGKNVFRFINIVASQEERNRWDKDSFDVNKGLRYNSSATGAKFNLPSATITKDNSGNTRPNGTVQYILTLFNKYGQETNYLWASDVIYLSPVGSGGAADGTNNNKITLKFTGLDKSFSHYRIYSITRTSLNGELVAHLITEGKIIIPTGSATGSVTVVDDYSHQTVVDVASLLYLGSKAVVPGTIEHKDQTLFLGNLSQEDLSALYSRLEGIVNEIRNTETESVSFVYSDDQNTASIPYVTDGNLYPYVNQLEYSSNSIKTFKGGEKYRFALVFHFANGDATKAFWIGDYTNNLYPVIDVTTDPNSPKIRRIVARVDLTIDGTATCWDGLHDYGITSLQVMIAQPSDADRSVKAQGFLCPTVFNLWSRYNGKTFSESSWLTRPRNSAFACTHFEPIHNSTSSTGEIECNYWTSQSSYPTPYYNLRSDDTIDQDFDGEPNYDTIMVIYMANRLNNDEYQGGVVIIKGIRTQDTEAALDNLLEHEFDSDTSYSDYWGKFAYGTGKLDIYETGYHITITKSDLFFVRARVYDSALTALHAQIYQFLKGIANIPDSLIIDKDGYNTVLSTANIDWGNSAYFNPVSGSIAYSSSSEDSFVEVINDKPDDEGERRWVNLTGGSPLDVVSKDYLISYYRKHMMFTDESVLTFHSPEIQYNAVNIDNMSGLKLRIVGIAKMSSIISDYTVDASHGKLPGNNLIQRKFSTIGEGLAGIISWPLWKEYGLEPKDKEDSKEKSYAPSDYTWSGSVVNYWLHMWNHLGKINGFTDDDNSDYSTLRSKVFANCHVSHTTIYNPGGSTGNNKWNVDLAQGSVRQFNYTNDQFVSLNVNGNITYYSGNVHDSLLCPAGHEYPILYSSYEPDGQITSSSSWNICSSSPVQLTYLSSPHVVLSLPLTDDTHRQEILPRLRNSENTYIDDEQSVTAQFVPWVTNQTATFLPYIDAVSDNQTAMVKKKPGTDDIYIYSISNQAGAPTITTDLRDEIELLALHIGSVPAYYLFPGNDGTNYLAEVNNYHLANGGNMIAFEGRVIESAARSSGTNKYVYVRKYMTASEPEPGEELRSFKLRLCVNTGTLTDAPDVTGTYSTNQRTFKLRTDYSTRSDVQTVLQTEYIPKYGDQYLYIAELYKTFTTDTRYGGQTEEAFRNNIFIPASKISYIDNNVTHVIATEGDTYFQRWDCLKTLPRIGNQDGVIDITSVMLETHINIDGRTDRQRGISTLASINTDTFGNLNPVYTQQDNYFSKRIYEKDADAKNYRASITWTLDKKDDATTDEWTHITLANSLALDGDKGECRKLKKFNNTLYAFQDRAISEILFNSRTQLSTTDGVPVEIANSGKVDGKRIITGNYGCMNKWSIVSGKQALYFVDNINKAFCAFTGSAVENISTKLGFDVWFNLENNTEPWKPVVPFNNFVAYYDRVQSDVYLLKNPVTSAGVPQTDNSPAPCLVYSELLGTFTSFYDYANVPMMANIKDLFVSFYGDTLYLQNAGYYCDFYGQLRPYWMHYRVAPEPTVDKIWTNLEYRADFYSVFNQSGAFVAPQSGMIDGGDVYSGSQTTYNTRYMPNITFDKVKLWNEYQQTDLFGNDANTAAKKKFRIWRFIIPRACKTASNKYGFDRIRNPWINIMFRKDTNSTTKKYLMQMHDMVVRYYE